MRGQASATAWNAKVGEGGLPVANHSAAYSKFHGERAQHWPEDLSDFDGGNGASSKLLCPELKATSYNPYSDVVPVFDCCGGAYSPKTGH